MTVIDPEAAAFFADARAALNPPRPLPATCVAEGPLVLDDLSGMPAGLPPGPFREALADPNSRASWTPEFYDALFAATARKNANEFAREATEIEATREPGKPWARHRSVVVKLAAAETAAPEADRAWHAARLDAYVAAHGIRGWYRKTSSGGHYHPPQHFVQVNLLRTAAEGDRGRYYFHETPNPQWRETRYWVIDRDTGETAHRSPTSGLAQQWIDDRESTLPSSCPSQTAA